MKADLTPSQIRALLRLIDTHEKRRRVADLCNLREYLEKLFVYADSPLCGHQQHPLYSLLITSNDLIGALIKQNETIDFRSTAYGKEARISAALKPLQAIIH